MDINKKLDEIQAWCDAATELTPGDDNAHLAYAVASEGLPAAIAALRAVVGLHLPASGAVWCTCGLLYPCDTFRTITEALDASQ